MERRKPRGNCSGKDRNTEKRRGSTICQNNGEEETTHERATVAKVARGKFVAKMQRAVVGVAMAQRGGSLIVPEQTQPLI